MNTQQPSVWRIISVDYAALLAILFPGVTWGGYVGFALFFADSSDRGWDPLLGDNGLPFWFWFALAETVLSIPTLMWRVTRIRGILACGEEAPGEVLSVSFYRDRGRIEYTYSYHGQEHRNWNAVHKTARTTALQQGQKITVAVDPQGPKRAVIKDLYID